jgi:hypothetical protein
MTKVEIEIEQWFWLETMGCLWKPTIEVLSQIGNASSIYVEIIGTESELDGTQYALIDKVNANKCGTNFLLSPEYYVLYLPETKEDKNITKNGKIAFLF